MTSAINRAESSAGTRVRGADAADDSGQMADAWEELRRYLVGCAAQLADELHHYPSPIARCDEQLPKLLEQRRAVLGQLASMESIDAQGGGVRERCSLLRAFAGTAPLSDDADETILRAKLAGVVGRAAAAIG
jgi:hypothetical protein